MYQFNIAHCLFSEMKRLTIEAKILIDTLSDRRPFDGNLNLKKSASLILKLSYGLFFALSILASKCAEEGGEPNI